ncbi:unnamed protein product [Miscanthus lutarioriparius]|uniref:Uncharacterized protein n=1 Tax=Miscanthus lutarioriparius TaxID=422564 RepID=A0A811RCV5_9POAL|nr:unnamed protein product [Miscanthus lutarioriparius]
MAGRERDRELLLPVVAGEHVAGDEGDSEPTTPAIIAGPPPPTMSARVLHLHHHPTGIEVIDPLLSFVERLLLFVFHGVFESDTELGMEEVHVWMVRTSSSVILLPIAITFYTTWWFIRFVDGFFSPIYVHLGIHLFGLGFVTSITFIFLVGVFMSSWLGASLLGLGEFFIKRMPLVRHIYSASKQISAAISPDQSSRAFKEVVIIRHPRIGEYALGFITSTVALRGAGVRGDQDLASPTTSTLGTSSS